MPTVVASDARDAPRWHASFDSARRVSLKAWRAVEAQHVVATNPLTDSLADQALLEDILDASKPPVPAEASGLHWLLFTPFRYPPLPGGSRFRAPGSPGIWYGAPAKATACAELGFWRWRFLMASPSLPMLAAQPQTLFQVALRGRAIDLRRPPLVADRQHWIDPIDYRACQALTFAARAHAVDLIRYESVRDPEHRDCVAALNWRTFAEPAPIASETWMLHVARQRISWSATDVMAPQRFDFNAPVAESASLGASGQAH